MVRGFTVIELVIVVGAAAILVLMSMGVYISFLRKSFLDVTAREMQSVFNLARSQTLASEEAQNFGVHIDTANNEYVLFSGQTYDSSNPDNELFSIHRRVSVSSIDISGGGSDVVFDRLTGETAHYGVITLQDVTNPSSALEICIHEYGIIEVQDSCNATTLEYSGGTTDGNLASFPANAGDGDPAQSFTTASNDIYARAAKLYLRRVTVDPSDVFVEIRETSTIGNVIGRSWIVDGSSVSSTYSWVRFDFATPVSLQSATQYFLRLRSLPDSSVSSSGANGTIYWGYINAAASPPAYGGGDAWRYVNQGNNPLYGGEKLGPINQYDFSFEILYGVDPPPITDSRHLEFELLDSSGFGWSIQGATTLTLVFNDFPVVTKNVAMASFFNASSTAFDWEEEIDVNGNAERIRVHTRYLDSNDTVLSIHRDKRFNDKGVDISIDAKSIVSYAPDGTPTVGGYGGNMVYK